MYTPSRRILALSFIITASILLCCTWNQVNIEVRIYYRNSNLTQIYPEIPIGNKIIFINFTRVAGRYPHFMKDTSEACPRCSFVVKPEYLNKSHAVLISAGTRPIRDPASVSPHQIWIWFYYEAPKMKTLKKKYEKYGGRYNWTMTFREDSDIYVPEGYLLPFKMPEILSPDQKWAYRSMQAGLADGSYNKSMMPVPTVDELLNRKTAAWIVSNCGASSRRQVIVRQLQKYITVDVYGGCGKLKCPGNYYTDAIKEKPDCRKHIAQQYKFYLSFENSLCEDYVTEKFFLTFFTQMVPVVFGAANYSKYAPQGSYINVMDFDNVEALAYYLLYLDKNPSEFLKYFDWRKDYWVQSYGHAIFANALCQICDKVWDTVDNSSLVHSENTKTYNDITAWWTQSSHHNLTGKNSCMAFPPKFNEAGNTTIRKQK